MNITSRTKQRVAELTERAAHLDSLSDEAERRGNISHSIKFAEAAEWTRVEAREIEEMGDWPGLTDGQARGLAREFCAAISGAASLEEIPSDAWLNARLCALGCPDQALSTWRERIKALPLLSLADGAA